MSEFTFALIKSQAIRHNLHGIVLARIMENNFVIHRAEWMTLSRPVICEFYRDHLGKPYWNDLEQSVAGHVIALILMQDSAITRWRSIMGDTDPKKAVAGTIRALAHDEPILANNVVHGSDSQEAARREIYQIFGGRSANGS